MRPRIACLFFALLATALAVAPIVSGGQNEKKLKLKLRSRQPSDESKDGYVLKFKEKQWPATQTAIIVCDVWDAHHCLNAVRRLDEMVPRMNEVLEKARSEGVFIIHAPSECMPAYKDSAGRKLAQAAPPAKKMPKDISQWCHKIPTEEKVPYPIDQSDGGEDDDPQEHAEWHAKLKAMDRDPKIPWKMQHPGIKILPGDAISDSGVEIWNLLEQKGIDHVILLGVHTNMCVLGRPFGLRQMVKNGKQVVLMRDLTDTMYNPKKKPFVNHFKGTELIIEYIEKCVCPTITSDQIAGGMAFRFKADSN